MTATVQPLEARCDGCKQLRPVFLYQPEHGHMLPPQEAVCPWCSRDKQPLLCTRCYSAERQREENDPRLASEHAALERICAANRRAIENGTVS